MSKNQRWYELRSSLWPLPMLYTLLAVVAAFAAYGIEFGLQPALSLGSFFTADYALTEMIYSTLAYGVLMIHAFTFTARRFQQPYGRARNRRAYGKRDRYSFSSLIRA